MATTTTQAYRGRLAPSPTGFLHLGHAYTFWTAEERAQRKDGVLVLRNEDLDRQRCKEGFVEALLEDLEWLGIAWHEGLGKGGPHAPYSQSERLELYKLAFNELRERDLVYPCTCSRQDVMRALSAPHEGSDEPVYPGTCRANAPRDLQKANWRFRVPDGLTVQFEDNNFGAQVFKSGVHFGDFVVWRGDNCPSYQLAVVVDDAAMGISEVVRGSDLLLSTARQLLLYQALKLQAPEFYHTPIVNDDSGSKLSKRHDALAVRNLKQQGLSASEVRSWWEHNREVIPRVAMERRADRSESFIAGSA